jgi:uncharacterized SAM-binding protein YcdF (DUF218 family)
MWHILKVTFAPGSLPGLVVLLGAGFVLLRFRSTRRLARVWIAVVVALYLVLSLPFTAHLLAEGLQGSYEPLASSPRDTPGEVSPAAARLDPPFAVVVFDGDHADSRVQETARLYRQLGPAWVVVSGDDEMYEGLVRDGVPPGRVVRETAATTTREQALAVVPILRRLAIDRFVLVASSIHIRRAAGAVRATGLRPLPSPSDGVRHRRPFTAAELSPEWRALRLSEESLYEYGALALYWVRGWLG